MFSNGFFRLRLHQPEGIERRAADEDAAGLLGQRHIVAARVVRDRRDVAERVLDQQVALGVEPVGACRPAR